MFSITFGFVLPGIFRAYGGFAWLVWLAGINAMWRKDAFGVKVWVRLLGFSVVLDIESVNSILGEDEKTEKMTVSETILTKNGSKTTRNIEENMDTEKSNWLMHMISSGYKYVISDDGIYDGKDKSFRLPTMEGVGIEIGDRIAFGTQVGWEGVKVVGFREEEKDTIYFVEPVKKEARL